MSNPNAANDHNSQASLVFQIAGLAEANGRTLDVEALRDNSFLSSWRQDSKPDIVIAKFFSALGITTGSDDIPLDTVLHYDRLDYEKEKEDVGKIEFDAREFVRANLIQATSDYTTNFNKFRERVQEMRDTQFDLLLDRAELFGHFVVIRAQDQADFD